MAPRITKRTWYWIGAAVLAAALIWLLWPFKEGFINTADEGTSFVVQAPLATLTAADTLKAIGTLQSGAYAEKFAPATIENYKGDSIWKAGAAVATDTTVTQYRLVFPSTINYSKFKEPGKLPAGVTYIGPDFTSLFIIVKGDPGVIIDPFNTGNADNNYRGTFSSLGTGRNDGTYAVSKITNQTGTVFYDKNAPMTTAFYTMTFDSNVDLKRIQDFIARAKAGGITRGEKPENSPILDSKLNLLTLKGISETDTTTDFTGVSSKVVVFQGPLHAVLNPGTREVAKWFSEAGATAAAAAQKADEDLDKGGFSTGTTGTIEAKRTAMYRAREAAAAYLPTTITGGSAGEVLWRRLPYFGVPYQVLLKVEFIAPVNLRLATEQVPKKIIGVTYAQLKDGVYVETKEPARYVGLAFTDTPPALPETGAGSMAQLGTVDYTTIYTPYAPPSQFPTTFLASGESAGTSETPASADFTASTTYTDPRSQPVASTTDYSGYVTNVTPLTNRIKVRGQWSIISKPGVIATFGIAAGKGPDGTYPKVVEILDYKEQKVWPTGNYVDTGMSELFTIGYDVMIDPKKGLEDYIRAFMPSVTYVNPAMPRT